MSGFQTIQCKVSLKSSENCDSRRVDRQTDVTDASDFNNLSHMNEGVVYVVSAILEVMR